MIDINFISPTGGIVKSVNGMTGRVELTATDVGAATEEFVAQKIAEAELAGGDVDLSAYYTKSETKTEINKAIAAIPEPDLSGYALKKDIPSTAGLATEKYVDDAVAGVEVDLTGYATEEYVGQKITEAQLGGKDVDLSNYYTKAETETAISTAIGKIEIPEEPDLSGYALKTEIPNLEGYATETYVAQEIAKIEIPEDQDLSKYALKSEIPDVSGFITEVPAEYITETELAAAGYQTQAQVLALINANLPASAEGVEY